MLTSEGVSLSVLNCYFLRNAGESNRHGRTYGRKPVLKTGRATRPTHSWFGG